jgi:hypothetical protein
MQKVRNMLRNVLAKTNPPKNPFKMVGRRLAYVLPGEDEGVYTWMTYNHLKGTLAADSDKAIDAFHKTLTDQVKPYEYKSTGIIEVGGASTQVVFVSRSEPLAHSYHLHVDGADVTLYDTSFMGFGNDQAAQKLLQGQATSVCAVKGTSMKRYKTKPAENPRVIYGVTIPKLVPDLKDGALQMEDVPAAATYSDTECEKAIVNRVLEFTIPCSQESCAFAGRYMPNFPKNMKIAVVSTFERVRDALNCGSGEKTNRGNKGTVTEAETEKTASGSNLNCINDRIKKVCAATSVIGDAEKATLEANKKKPFKDQVRVVDGPTGIVKTLETFGNARYSFHPAFTPSLCFQGKLAVAMLHEGFGIAMDRPLTFVDKKSLNKVAAADVKVTDKAAIGWDYGGAIAFVKLLERLGELPRAAPAPAH